LRSNVQYILKELQDFGRSFVFVSSWDTLINWSGFSWEEKLVAPLIVAPNGECANEKTKDRAKSLTIIQAINKLGQTNLGYEPLMRKGSVRTPYFPFLTYSFGALAAFGRSFFFVSLWDILTVPVLRLANVAP
jgi:hypothetical protein